MGRRREQPPKRRSFSSKSLGQGVVLLQPLVTRVQLADVHVTRNFCI